MIAAPLVYEEIKRDLLRRLGRQWPVGTQLPSASALARELGTGQRNTLRALQELAREGYLRSRKGRGTFVARHPSGGGSGGGAGQPASAQRDAVRTKVQPHIRILLRPNSDRFLMDIAESLAQTLALHGAEPQYHWVDRPDKLDDPMSRESDGLAIINPGTWVRGLAAGCSAVVISSSNRVRVDASGGYDIVSVEEDHGGYMAGELLRQSGCQNACFVGVRQSEGSGLEPTSAIRLRGFQNGWGEPLPSQHILLGRSYMADSGSVIMQQFAALNPRPQAIFAASDDLAIGLAIGGLALGLMPGRDYQLIGFDGQQRARIMSECPPLTSIAIPSIEMGRRAAQLLMQRLETPAKPVERVLLGCSLFRGGTVTHPCSIR